MTVRSAYPNEVRTVAELHASRITEGFLTSLGPPFLRRLYRRVSRDQHAFLLVDSREGVVTGFVAGVTDLGGLYRRFLLRDGIIAGIQAARHVIPAVPRLIETLKYPSATEALPDAEILAVAVHARSGGRGVGTSLVRAATQEFERRAVVSAKVVTTADNVAALAMYRSCGFVSTARIEVHAGRGSEVLVWTAS